MDHPDVLHRAGVAERLGRAFAVWRLRPDDPEQEAFQVACSRLTEAVAGGPVTLGIHGSTFVVGTGETVEARPAGALAEGLYRIGIEKLRVHRAPDASELTRFFRAVEDAADRDDLHELLGVVNGVLEPVSLAPTTAQAEVATETEGWREIWDELADPGTTAGRLADAGADADTLIQRMIALRGELPEEQQRAPELADRLHAALLKLPRELRTTVARELTEAPDAAFPGWFLSSLTDHDLGRLLEGAAPDVEDLARSALGRDLRDLSPGVELAPAPPDPAAEGPDGPPARAREGEPMGLASLELFLSVEARPARLRAALVHWQERIEDALHGDDLDTVHDLLAMGHRVAAVADHDLTPALDVAAGLALGPEQVESLLPPLGEPLRDRTLDVLRAFGPVAVDALLGRLVVEEDAQRRAQLVSVLAALVPGHTAALSRWLDDPRWFVVRNLVTALWRAADPTARPLLARTAEHAEPRVRLESARAYAALGEVDGLARLAADADAEVRRSARRLLTGLGSPAAAASLAAVARDEGVPLPDRRSAVDALADHPHGAGQLAQLADDRSLPLRLRWQVGRVSGGTT